MECLSCLHFSDEVRMPNITKYPNKDYYVVGLDTSIDLTCKSKGNPQPDYFWYKDNSVNVKSASENLTIMVMNKTDSGVYTCRVNNTFSGDTYRSSADVKVDVRNEGNLIELESTVRYIFVIYGLSFKVCSFQLYCLSKFSVN